MTYLDYDVVFPQLDKINEFVFETVTTDFSNPKKIKKNKLHPKDCYHEIQRQRK